ncbi:hypothetical protein EBB05_15910 [Methylobacterium brachiatum]|nr:hypothetical protein EBB05_15910 [Methylobacterium brachiatum]
MFAPRPRPVLAAPEPVPVPVLVDDLDAVEPTEDDDDLFVTRSLEAYRPQRISKQVTARECLQVVTLATGMDRRDLIGERRAMKLVKARQIAAWALVHRLGRSSPETGRILGGRDHTTVLHACRRAQKAAVHHGVELPTFPDAPLLNVDPLDIEMVEACTAARVTTQIGVLGVCVGRLWAIDWPDQIKRGSK